MTSAPEINRRTFRGLGIFNTLGDLAGGGQCESESNVNVGGWCASVYGRLGSISNWPNPVAVDTIAWPSAMHRSWKPPNEPHLHLKGAPITLAAFYFIDVAREPRGCAPSTLQPPSPHLRPHSPLFHSSPRYPAIFISSR